VAVTEASGGMRFCSRDLDLDPMTFMYELDLSMYTRIANTNFLSQHFQKSEHCRQTLTDATEAATIREF